MIRIERVRLPPGMKAFARREDGTVFVYVSAGLSAGERLVAIRETLRAAPGAGWRSGRHPVLLPALAGGAGLRRAPEGRWAYWVLLTAVVAVAASLVAMTLLYGQGARHDAAVPPGALLQGQPPGGQASPQPGRASGPGGGRSSPARPGSAPGRQASPKPSLGGPAPQGSGKPTPGTSPAPEPLPRPSPPSGAPTPSSSPSPWPSPSPSPSPSKSSSSGSSGSPGACVDVLGVTVCV